MIKAPEPIKKTMTKLRVKGAPSMGGLKSIPFSMYRPEQNNIKAILPNFEYGKTHIDESTAAAAEKAYNIHRTGRMAKVDTLLAKTFRGKPILNPTGLFKKELTPIIKRLV